MGAWKGTHSSINPRFWPSLDLFSKPTARNAQLLKCRNCVEHSQYPGIYGPAFRLCFGVAFGNLTS